MKKFTILLILFLVIPFSFSAKVFDTRPQKGDMIVVAETEFINLEDMNLFDDYRMVKGEKLVIPESSILVVLDIEDHTGITADKILVSCEDPREDFFLLPKFLISEKKFSEMRDKYRKTLKMAEKYREMKERQKLIKEFKEKYQEFK